MRFVLRGAPEDHVILKMAQGPGFRVTRWGYPVAQVNSRAGLGDRRASAWFYDAAAQTLFVRLDGDGAEWNEIMVRPSL